jgi:predicted RNA-binding Zn-ribbon protein involved in translation (DUF1610 family)
MAMRTCEDCKQQISDTAMRCPHCGGQQIRHGTKSFVYGGLVLLLVGLILSYAC